MKTFSEWLEINEGYNWNELGIPPKPGTSPIPPGHIRLYHQTESGNIDSILKHGLQRSYSKGKSVGDPSVIWASAEPYSGSFSNNTTVEFSLPNDRFRPPYYVLIDSVPPESILAIHEDWHMLARGLISDYPNPNNETIKLIASFRDIDKDHQKAVDAYFKYID